MTDKTPTEPCPFCGETLVLATMRTSAGESRHWAHKDPLHSKCYAARFMIDEDDAEEIDAWNSRAQRPTAPAMVAEAVKWARIEAADNRRRAARHDAECRHQSAHLFNRAAAHLDTLAAAAERALTEAQRRDIAEAWAAAFETIPISDSKRRLYITLRAANII